MHRKFEVWFWWTNPETRRTVETRVQRLFDSKADAENYAQDIRLWRVLSVVDLFGVNIETKYISNVRVYSHWC